MDFFEKKEDSEVLLEINLYNKVAEVVGQIIYIRDLFQHEIVHFSLESVENAEDWLCSILCALKAKPLLDSPISEPLSDDSITALLSEWDQFGISHPPPSVKVSSLMNVSLQTQLENFQTLLALSQDHYYSFVTHVALTRYYS